MKPTLILVDGMNIANRSEMAQNILKRFKKDEVEFYDCSEITHPYLYVRMMRDVLDRRKSVVMESSWRDEYILQKLATPPRMAREMLRMLDRIAFGCDAIVAHCYADSKTYAKNANLISSYDQMKDMIYRVDGAWGDMLQTEGLSYVMINTSDSGSEIDIDALMERVELRAGSNIGPGIGNWKPGQVTLLVGDRHGPSIQPYKVDMNLAFCDMAKAGSSFWLSKQLDQGNIAEKDLYWINAYHNNEATDPVFIEDLKPKTVLTLGDEAARWCQANKIRFEPFQHPQFHKRFKHSEPYPLIARLQELK